MNGDITAGRELTDPFTVNLWSSVSSTIGHERPGATQGLTKIGNDDRDDNGLSNGMVITWHRDALEKVEEIHVALDVLH